MIYKISCCEKDESLFKEYQSKHCVTFDDFPQNLLLEVSKPWGKESIICLEGNNSVWSLHIQNGERTSFHCHLKKDVIMIVLNGKVKVKTSIKDFILKPMDIMIVGKGAFHSIGSVSNKGSKVLEINAPHLLGDLIRVEDKYGREGKTYFPKN